MYIDFVIPRGRGGLVRFVTGSSKIPVLKHYKGVCHIFVDKDIDLDKVTLVILNAKIQSPVLFNASGRVAARPSCN